MVGQIERGGIVYVMEISQAQILTWCMNLKGKNPQREDSCSLRLNRVVLS